MRLVLVNVPRPELIVLEMVSLVRPGGWIASFEADFLDISAIRRLPPGTGMLARPMSLFRPPEASTSISVAGCIVCSGTRGIEAISVDAVEHAIRRVDRRPTPSRDFIDNVRGGLVA